MTARKNELGFRDAATDAFAFLERRGFARVVDEPARIAKSAATTVVYESARARLSLSFDGERSYELELRVGLVDDDTTSVSLQDALAAAKHPRAGAAFQASAEKRVRTTLEEMARLVESELAALLDGDRGAFEAIVADRDRRARELTERVVDAPRRARAEAAWRERDWARVVEAYESVEGELAASEREKLEMARRRAGG